MWYTPVSIKEFKMEFTGSYGMSSFNSWLQSVMCLPPTYEGMISAVNSTQWAKKVISKNNKQPKWNQWLTPNIAKFIRQPNGPQQFLSIVMDALAPKNTGFKLMSISEFATSSVNNRECWVGGPVVAIRADVYPAFLKAIKKKAKPTPLKAKQDNTEQLKDQPV